MAMALFAMAVMLGPAVGPDPRRVDRRQLLVAVDLLHQHPGRHRGPRDGRHLRARGRGDRRQEPRARRGPAQERRLVGHRPHGRGPLLAAVRARGGAAGRLVPVEAHPRDVARRRRRHRGLRHPRAHVRGAGRQHPPLQGSGVPLGHAHRLADVRAAHGDDVPLAAVHADAARLHGHRRGLRAHAARARHDGRRADRRAHLQRRLAAHRDRRRRVLHRLGRVQHEPLHDADEPGRASSWR